MLDPGFWLVVNTLAQNPDIGRGVAKLFDTVSDQIGLFGEPWHVRRMAHARAEETVVDAKAGVDAAKITFRGKLAIKEIKARQDERLRTLENKRQENIETTLAHAARELHDDNDVSPTPVDPDWLSQFLSHCQDISSEDVQVLWGRILAGEVRNPGSFSRRTLASVYLLSREEANKFTKLCSAVWEIPEGPTPFLFHRLDGSAQFVDLGFQDLCDLEHAGLIRHCDNPGGYFIDNVDNPDSPSTMAASYLGRSFVITFHHPREQLQIGKVLLTSLGKELFPISGAVPNEEYLNQFLNHVRAHDFKIEPV